MRLEQSIEQAINTIGAEEPEDYVISPTSHAEQFRERVPELATILESSAVKIVARQYEEADASALTAQKKFKTASKRANLMVFITTILTALVLATGTLAPHLPNPLEFALLIAFGLATVVLGAIATKDLAYIRSGKLLEEWMSERATAETDRIKYFDTIVGSDAAGTATTQSGIPINLLKLEYFRRFQLDVQRAYFRKRGRQHREEAEKTLNYGSWAVAGAAAATGLASVLSIIDVRFAAIAALGTVFAGLSSFSGIREAANQDRRNAERYGRTSRALDEIAQRLDPVRNLLLTSGSEPLHKFVEAVNEQLSLEHRQWLDLMNSSQVAFKELEKMLHSNSTSTPGAAPVQDPVKVS